MGGVSMNLGFPESYSSIFTGLIFWGHFESILRMLEDDWSIAFTFVLTAFLMASFQESSSRLWASN